MITPHQAKILFPDVTSIEALHSAFASKLGSFCYVTVPNLA